jgi:carbonic anhydrase/acetyltransferase-like protein (isoleucine patch superfamily)
VTVGHSVVLHGCTIGNDALIGIGSIVLNGAEVGEGAMIGAGSLVTPGTKVPPGMLAFGSPARVKRPLTDEEKRQMREAAEHYVRLGREHL